MTTDDNFADDNLPDTDEDEADEEGIHADGKVHLTVCPKVLMRTSTTIPYPSQIKDGTDEKVYIPMTRHKFMFTVYSPDDNLPDTDEDEKRTRNMYIPMNKHTFMFTMYSLIRRKLTRHR